MAPNPQISQPFPTQIASGQALSAAAVDANFDHIASTFNAHTHDSGDITSVAAIFLPIGGIIQWPAPTSFISALMYCDGATYSVSAFPALASAVSTYHGGNASIGKLPDMRGRMVAGWGGAAGHADVATVGNSDGVAVGSRKPKHKHDKLFSMTGNQAGGGANAGGAPFSGGYTSDTTSALIDTPAYIVLPYLIRAL